MQIPINLEKKAFLVDTEIHFYTLYNQFMDIPETIKYYLLMIANPLSSSEVAISIYKKFCSIDVLSRDITIFFPGFQRFANTDRCTENEGNERIDSLMKYNHINCIDYHGISPIYHAYCDSTGDVYFNDADFSKFIIDFENKIPKFEYDGRPVLVLLPSLRGEILYGEIKWYDLEALIDAKSRSTQKIDEFFVSLLNLLQKDEVKNSLTLFNKIDAVYNAKLSSSLVDTTKEKVTIHLDGIILDRMKWKQSDEIFFISYSSKDVYHAFTLKTLLEKNNKHVWIAPDGIPDGSDYACAIPAALRISSRVVALLSHHSANSMWVRREVGKAISNNKKIDGILVDDFTIEDLRQYDHFDFLFEGVQVKYSILDLSENRENLHEWLYNN